VNKDSKRVFEVSHWFKDTLKLKGKQLEMPPNLDKLIYKGNSKPKHQVFIGTDRYDGIYPRYANEYFYPKSWLNNFNVYPHYDSGTPYPYNKDDVSKIKENGKTWLGKIDNRVGMVNNLPSITNYLYDAKVRKRNNIIRFFDPLTLTKKESDDVVKRYKDNTHIYKYDNLLNNLQRGIASVDPTNLIYGALKLIEYDDYNKAIEKAQALKKGRVHSFKTKDTF